MALVPVHHRHRVVQRGAAVPASLHLSPCVFMSGSAIIRSHPSARLVSSINLVHLLSRSRVSVTVPRSDHQATRTPINTLARARTHTHTHTFTHTHTQLLSRMNVPANYAGACICALPIVYLQPLSISSYSCSGQADSLLQSRFKTYKVLFSVYETHDHEYYATNTYTVLMSAWANRFFCQDY